MNFLITGVAGFIGFHISKCLLEKGNKIFGIDNLNNYYDVDLKKARLNILRKHFNFIFIQINLNNTNEINTIFKKYNFQKIIHLGAQAGVRYSITNPYSYIDSNILGFLNILEGCKKYKIEHLLYASSSSVYGLNNNNTLSIDNKADYPLSLYAFTKKSNELMAHTYSYLYDIPTTGIRLFTVYGPWGRPDMAIFKFTKSIIEGKNIDVYNNGFMKRDFTYINDVVDVILYLQKIIPKKNKNFNKEKLFSYDILKYGTPAPYSIYNIGYGKSVNLIKCISILEKELNIVAKKNMIPMQLGDMYETQSDNSELCKIMDYKPKFNIEKGIKKFIDWYKKFYKI